MMSRTIKALVTVAAIASASAAYAQMAPNGGPSASQKAGAETVGGAQGGGMTTPATTRARVRTTAKRSPNGGPSTSQNPGRETVGGAKGTGVPPTRQ